MYKRQVIGSTVKPGDKLLILSNGAYGDRMGNIAEYHGINYDMLAFDETEQAVSYTHLDVYKRQIQSGVSACRHKWL